VAALDLARRHHRLCKEPAVWVVPAVQLACPRTQVWPTLESSVAAPVLVEERKVSSVQESVRVRIQGVKALVVSAQRVWRLQPVVPGPRKKGRF
jgi:hypothetical protein